MEREKIRYGKIKKLMFKEFVGEDPGWTRHLRKGYNSLWLLLNAPMLTQTSKELPRLLP